MHAYIEIRMRSNFYINPFSYKSFQRLKNPIIPDRSYSIEPNWWSFVIEPRNCLIRMKVLSFILLSLAGCQNQPKPISSQETMNASMTTIRDQTTGNDSLEIATLGAGCFWCVEAIFQDLNGVVKVESGYSGGGVKNPSYREVCTGTTGHAEVCQIHFNPKQISFEEILEVFWTTHDPTTLNRQGADAGTQYRSAIFYHSEAQKNAAEKSKSEVATQIWEDPIVTEVTAFTNFYPAEDYHQDYFNLNGSAPYCQMVIAPKVKKFRAKFDGKLKKK